MTGTRPRPARISSGASGGSFGGSIDPNDPQLRAWFRKLPDLGGPGSAELQRQRDDANRRIEALERRLDKLGPH